MITTFVLSVLVVALTIDRFLHSAKFNKLKTSFDAVETRIGNVEASLKHGVSSAIDSLSDRLDQLESASKIAADSADKIVQKITGKTSDEVLATPTSSTGTAGGTSDQSTN